MPTIKKPLFLFSQLLTTFSSWERGCENEGNCFSLCSDCLVGRRVLLHICIWFYCLISQVIKNIMQMFCDLWHLFMIRTERSCLSVHFCAYTLNVCGRSFYFTQAGWWLKPTVQWHLWSQSRRNNGDCYSFIWWVLP